MSTEVSPDEAAAQDRAQSEAASRESVRAASATAATPIADRQPNLERDPALERNLSLTAAFAVSESAHELKAPETEVCTSTNPYGLSDSPALSNTTLTSAYVPSEFERLSQERTSRMLDAVGDYIKEKLNPFTDEGKLYYELVKIHSDINKQAEKLQENNRQQQPVR